nr:acyloxyacyl hydrolase [Pseudopontixanthobacter vadosimaris]
MRPIRTSGLRSFAVIAISGSFIPAVPAAAGEVYGGVYAHAVETPFTFDTEEGGVDLQAGYRFDRLETLHFIGRPQPYVFASLNSDGDTNFAGGGLSWKIAAGPVYVRPGIGVVIHDAPGFRVDRNNEFRTDLGSRILFEPEIAVGTALSGRWSVEASWVHISNAQLFNSQQNPGIDTIGIRLNYAL